MKVTTTMMYEIAKIIGGDLEMHGCDSKATKVCPKHPLYISDIEKLFERFCPNADKVLELEQKLEVATNENIHHGVTKALCKNKIAELERENKQLKDAYEVLVEKSKELMDEKKELKSRCDFLLKENARLSTLSSLKEDRIEIVKQRCEEAEEEKKELQKDYERLAMQYVTLNTSNDMLHSSNEVLGLDNERKDKEIEKKNEEIDRLNTALAEANKKLHILENLAMIERLQNKLAGGEVDCSKCECRKDSEKKDTKIKHLTHSIVDMNNQIISLQATAEGLQKKLDKAYTDLRDKKDNVYEMEIRKLRKERDKYHNDFKSIKGTYEKTLKDIEKLKLVAKTYRDEKEECMSVRSDLVRENCELIKRLHTIDSPAHYTQFTADSMARYSGDNTWIVYEGDYILGFIVVNPEFAKEVGLEFYFREHNYNEIKDALTTVMRKPAIGALKTIFKEIRLTHDLSRESKI